ncbi:MAG: amidohydrolase family protein [Armatimonadota bacterium]|nr:amidohydrolase family protein [Armatimonadota bacterium]
MTGLRFFDAHCYVGRYKTFKPGSFYKIDDLQRQMEYYGISEALITHSMSREHHPIDGNAAVLNEIIGKQNLHASWSLLPPASKELPPPGKLIPDMISKNVKAVKLFYGNYSFPISEWCIGELLDELEARRVPTFIDPDTELCNWDEDIFDWNSVDALCAAHPALPVILQEGRFRSSNRLLYQLLDRHANLHIELSGYWAYHGIEFITREFGARRLLFGTKMPFRDPACAIAQLSYSDIPDEDKALIAGDNLRKLLGGVVA